MAYLLVKVDDDLDSESVWSYILAASDSIQALETKRDELIAADRLLDDTYNAWLELGRQIAYEWISQQRDCVNFTEGKRIWKEESEEDKTDEEIIDILAMLHDHNYERTSIYSRMFTPRLPLPTCDRGPKPQYPEMLTEDSFEIREIEFISLAASPQHTS